MVKRNRSRSANRWQKQNVPIYHNPSSMEQIVYVRKSFANRVLNASGNIDEKSPVSDLSFTTDWITYFGNLWQEGRVLTQTVFFIPSTTVVYGQSFNFEMASLMMVPYHVTIPASMTHQAAYDVIDSRWFSMADPKTKKLKWIASESDSQETQMWPLTSGTIPTTLGGIYTYADGPVLGVGSFAGDMIITYKVLVRGRR